VKGGIVQDHAQLIGAAGVALLLIAFFFNLLRRLSAESSIYLGMNMVGAGLACAASAFIGFIPFVVLEGVWCVVAAIHLFRRNFRR
jgi:predicted membrane channel-forming protein YqfA (hemolysin III family)